MHDDLTPAETAAACPTAFEAWLVGLRAKQAAAQAAAAALVRHVRDEGRLPEAPEEVPGFLAWLGGLGLGSAEVQPTALQVAADVLVSRTLGEAGQELRLALASYLGASQQRIADLANTGSVPDVLGLAASAETALQVRASRDGDLGPLVPFSILAVEALPPGHWLHARLPREERLDGMFAVLTHARDVSPKGEHGRYWHHACYCTWRLIRANTAQLVRRDRERREVARQQQEYLESECRRHDAEKAAQRRRDNPQLVIDALERRLEQLERAAR